MEHQKIFVYGQNESQFFSDSSSLCLVCVIFDLGDWETFSADYMEDFCPCFRGGFRGADYPRVRIYRGELRYIRF